MNAVAEAIWSRARAARTRTAVVTGREHISYSELIDRAEALAAEIRARATSPPARVLVRSRDPLEVLVFVLACWRTGCSAVVLHETSPPDNVANVGRRVGASAVLQDGRWIEGPEEGETRRPPDPNEALVLTTSGTSGAPKLVALPAASVYLNLEAIAAELVVDERDRLLGAQPLSRAYGLVGACLVGLRAGAEIHLEPARTPAPILQRAIRDRELTIVQGAPAFFQLFATYWNGKPFPSVRTWNTGGELSGPLLLGRIQEAFPRARGQVVFGMTEFGPRISHTPVDDPRVFEGYIGRPFDHIEWHIEKGGEQAGQGGRLRLRGPSMFLGYVGADGGYEGIDADGFFTSPDLVALDADGIGLVYRGRRDSLFKVGGFIVNPAVVEQALVRLPGVLEAQCLAEPDPVLGHVVAAEVVATDQSVDPELLLAACRQTLEPPSVPRTIHLVPRLARGGAGSKRTRLSTVSVERKPRRTDP